MHEHTLESSSDEEETILQTGDKQERETVRRKKCETGRRQKQGGCVVYSPHSSYLIHPTHVPSVQPPLIINGFQCLCLVVQVAHEHMATVHEDLCAHENKCHMMSCDPIHHMQVHLKCRHLVSMDAVLRCKLHFPYKLPILVDRFSPPKKTEVYPLLQLNLLAIHLEFGW